MSLEVLQLAKIFIEKWTSGNVVGLEEEKKWECEWTERICDRDLEQNNNCGDDEDCVDGYCERMNNDKDRLSKEIRSRRRRRRRRRRLLLEEIILIEFNIEGK